MTDAPLVAGFGAELVEYLIARELKWEGSMNFLADGVRYTIEIPLSGARRDE